jgi:hypothetical protein
MINDAELVAAQKAAAIFQTDRSRRATPKSSPSCEQLPDLPRTV